jgi:hypothetical protein
VADEVERAPVTAAARCLAVDGDHLPGGAGDHVPHPGEKTALEGGRIEVGDDPAEGVLRGNAARRDQG